MLKKADLVGVHGGQSGTYLLKSATEITLLDVYKAVNIAEDGKLFQVHEDTNQSCTIGANIQNALASILPKAQSAMEDVLREYTISDVAAQILALRQE
jgi:DNA-binding IscR family transcriptional regulator